MKRMRCFRWLLLGCFGFLLACGGGSADGTAATGDPQPQPQPSMQTASGILRDAPIDGIDYQCIPSGIEGVTQNGGSWTCQEPETLALQNRQIQFFLAGLPLGQPQPTSDNDITTAQLFDNQTEVVNLARLLLSLDPQAGVNAELIQIPANLPPINGISLADADFANQAEVWLASQGLVLVSESDAVAHLSNSDMQLRDTNLSEVGHFFIGGQLSDTDEYVHGSQVKFLTPALVSKPAVVLVSDTRISADVYFAAAEGNGWANMLARAGYPVFVYYHSDTAPSNLTSGAAALSKASLDSPLLVDQWGLSVQAGGGFGSARLSSPAAEHLFSSMVAKGAFSTARSGSNLRELLHRVNDRYGPALVVGHGDASNLIESLMQPSANLLAGWVAIEPVSCNLDSSSLQTLAEAGPVITLFADFAGTQQRANTIQNCADMLGMAQPDAFTRQILLQNEQVSGNSALMMIEDNQARIMTLLLDTLDQAGLPDTQVTTTQAESYIQSFHAYVVGADAPDTPNAAINEYLGGSLVQAVIPATADKKAPIVLYPGLGLSSSIFSTTIDGREGWISLFAKAGHPVFTFDPVDTSPSGISSDVASFTKWEVSRIWSRWGLGSALDTPYPNGKFPTDYAVGFYAMIVARGGNTGSNSANLELLLEQINSNYGRAILMGHSAAGPTLFGLADSRPELLAGIAALEPTACDTATPGRVADIGPFIAIYGDYIAARNQTGRFENCQQSVASALQYQGVASFVSLPDEGVEGNSHIYSQDANSAEIAARLIQFFE